MPNQIKVRAIHQPQSLFKDWVRLSNDKGISSEFEDYRLVETELDDEWTDIDNQAEKSTQQQHLQKYSAGEYLAHHLAYQNLTENSFQNVLEEDGSVQEYRCIPLKTNNEGLKGYILVPTAVEPGKTPDIKVIFRGTKPSSWASVRRDLEVGGAGNISFAENRDAILSQVNQAVKDFNKKHHTKAVSMSVAGHSLGGADAQNCLVALMQGISENCGLNYHTHQQQTKTIPVKARDGLSCIHNLKLFTYNSAGVTQATGTASKVFVGYMAEQRTKGRLKTKIECYHQHVGGDGVQQTNEDHILSDVPSRHAKVDVLKAQIGCERNHRLYKTLGAATTAAAIAGVPGALSVVGLSTVIGIADTAIAHTSHLHAEPMQVHYDTFSNATPKGRKQVKEELSYKSSILNVVHRGAGSIYNGLSSMANSASSMFYGYSKHKEKHSTVVVPVVQPEPVQQPVQQTKSRPWYLAIF